MSNIKITHNELVDLGRCWLSARSPVVVTEIASGAGEEPDVIGFMTRLKKSQRYIGYGTVLIECKISRSDFLSDKKKFYRRHAESGLAEYRLFLCPKGLISIDELPNKWGLLETQGKNIKFIHAPQKQECDRSKEVYLLASVLRRVKIPVGEHVSLTVKAYEYETKNRASLTIENR